MAALCEEKLIIFPKKSVMDDEDRLEPTPPPKLPEPCWEKLNDIEMFKVNYIRLLLTFS